MFFNSFEFFVFFPLVVLLYFAVPHKYRWLFLLVVSYYFYMAWKVEYAVIIAISTLVDFVASQQMSKKPNKSQRKPWLWLSLATNLGILGVFKYYGFFSENMEALFLALGLDYALPVSSLILPMGISFYTFQTMAYSIDVYHNRIQPERHLGVFALYVSFFPQLVAGPIERAQNLIPQFRKKVAFEYNRVSWGLKQMAWGFFKKVVIADRLAVLVNSAYADGAALDGLAWSYIAIAFTVQIYCDFSGYSDIAIGAARILGINLSDNFRTPFLSRSISEFWKRWHITLSTWFKDYVYIPLGGNRVLKWRWYFNLIVVFLVSGFWHGSNWTFIVWGGLHGCYIVLSFISKDFNSRFMKMLGLRTDSLIDKTFDRLITFSLVCFAFIYFRAETLGQGNDIATSIFSWRPSYESFKNLFVFTIEGQGLVSTLLMLIFLVVDQRMDDVVKGLRKLNTWSGLLIFATLIASIVIFGYFGEVDFIYFQF